MISTHGTNDMCSENDVSRLISKYFDEAVRFAISLCSRVGEEGEFAHFVRLPFLLEIFFRFADPADLRRCVDDGRNRVVVEMDWHALKLNKNYSNLSLFL